MGIVTGSFVTSEGLSRTLFRENGGRPLSFVDDQQTITFVTSGGLTPIYRGMVDGSVVYSTGSPPDGAIDVVIVGYT